MASYQRGFPASRPPSLASLLSLRRGLLTRVPPFPQDFKGFWESRFGGKKEREPEQNGSANGEANGSAPKRTADLAVYEQFEQQVRAASPGLFSILSGIPMHAGVARWFWSAD